MAVKIALDGGHWSTLPRQITITADFEGMSCENDEHKRGLHGPIKTHPHLYIRNPYSVRCLVDGTKS